MEPNSTSIEWIQLHTDDQTHHRQSRNQAHTNKEAQELGKDEKQYPIIVLRSC